MICRFDFHFFVALCTIHKRETLQTDRQTSACSLSMTSDSTAAVQYADEFFPIYLLLLPNSLQNTENGADFAHQMHVKEQKRFQLQGALLPDQGSASGPHWGLCPVCSQIPIIGSRYMHLPCKSPKFWTLTPSLSAIHASARVCCSAVIKIVYAEIRNT